MIYSEAFDGLPDRVRSRVFNKLASILHDGGESDEYAHLTDSNRRNVLEILLAILLETKPEFAAIQQSETQQ